MAKTWIAQLNITLLVVALLLPLPLHATEEDKGVYVPKNLEEAHLELERMLPPHLIAEMKNGTERKMVRYHRNLGMWIRNNWMGEDSQIKKYFNDRGIFHSDDISGIILKTFWCRLNNKPFRLDERIHYYQEYWKAQIPPEAVTPTDGAPIDWVITIDKSGNFLETIHLGISESDNTFWRYQYPTPKNIEPAKPEEVEDLKKLIKSWKEINALPDYIKQ